jgi:hypothetical protein
MILIFLQLHANSVLFSIVVEAHLQPLFLVKAYVQQPESSKLKLAQLEQELQKAHEQVTLSWLYVCLLSVWKILLCAVILTLFDITFRESLISSSGDQNICHEWK